MEEYPGTSNSVPVLFFLSMSGRFLLVPGAGLSYLSLLQARIMKNIKNEKSLYISIELESVIH